jgi:hypothetical protein
MDSIYQKPAWVHIPNGPESSKKEEGVLFGRTCDSLDLIAKGQMEVMNVGDWLYFPLMGAYTSATASEFNGFPKPHIVSEDGDILPTNAEAWDLVKDFQKNNVCLKYSNALVPIL